MNRDDEEPTATRRERMLCPTCYGSGRVIVDRMAVLGLRIGTAGVNEQCKHCQCEGFLSYETRIRRPGDPGRQGRPAQPPED